METMTTESKHTPERWKADELDEHTISIRLDSHYSHECIHIADVFVMSGNLGEEVPKAIARARLIAAAPETAAERDRLKEENNELFSENSHLKCENDKLTEANFNLLEALEFIVNCQPEPGEDAVLNVEGYNKACAALSKAKGQ